MPMREKEYVKLVNENLPIIFYGERVILETFNRNVLDVIKNAVALDEVKKELFCENGYKPCGMRFYNNCSPVPANFDSYDEGAKIIWAILNINKQNLALLRYLAENIRTKNYGHKESLAFSASKIMESLAVISETCGISFENMRDISFQHLNTQFPEYFNKNRQKIDEKPLFNPDAYMSEA